MRGVGSSDSSAKGARNGICNRTVCNHSHAIHYNRITQKYYCTPCARRLNEVPQWDGIPLCDWPTREQIGPDHLLLPNDGSEPRRTGLPPSP